VPAREVRVSGLAVTRRAMPTVWAYNSGEQRPLRLIGAITSDGPGAYLTTDVAALRPPAVDL
jgi:hypothetical protein